MTRLALPKAQRASTLVSLLLFLFSNAFNFASVFGGVENFFAFLFAIIFFHGFADFETFLV